MDPIDLRSDTVTRPTDAMRDAMAHAEVGDDVYGEDPTVALLEREVAELLGKETALFVPSGTMANQIGLALHAHAGDEILVGAGAHVGLYESGAATGISGIQLTPIPGPGTFDLAAFESCLHPDAFYYARQAAVAFENTHNHSGGRVFDPSVVDAIAERARERGLGVHLDGARLWNAAVATGRSPRELASSADTVSVCFSKGLGAPVGSALLIEEKHRHRALRLRRRLGGAMRQAGILAAGALHALRHHRDALAADHTRAHRLVEGLSAAGYACEAAETNIVVFDVDRAADAYLAAAKEAGVLMGAIGAQRIRAVTHRDVDDPAIERAIEVLAQLR